MVSKALGGKWLASKVTEAKITELRQEPIERVAEATTENAVRLFAPAITEAAAAGTSVRQGA